MPFDDEIPVDPRNKRKIVLGVVAIAVIALITVISVASIKKIAVGPDKAISTAQFK